MPQAQAQATGGQTNGRNVIGSGREDDAPAPPSPSLEHWRAACGGNLPLILLLIQSA